MRAALRAREARPRSFSAAIVSATRTWGWGVSALTSAPAAPEANAWSRKRWPSVASPFSAMKRWSGSTSRESKVTPVASKAVDAVPRVAAARHFPRAGGALENVAADRGRILAARIVVGDDDEIGQPRRHRAHLGPLADVAVAAGAEDDDQPPARMRP